MSAQFRELELIGGRSDQDTGSSWRARNCSVLTAALLCSVHRWQTGLHDVRPSAPRPVPALTRLNREEENEEEASGYAGVMQAIVSIFADEGDKIRLVMCRCQGGGGLTPYDRYVDAFPTKIAFVLKPSLYLLCISDWDEPEFVVSPPSLSFFLTRCSYAII